MSKRGERKEIICDICGKKIIRHLSSIQKHCSWRCYCKSRVGKKPGNYNKHYFIKERITKTCLKCGQPFLVLISRQNKKYCSTICFQQSRLTPEEKQIKQSQANRKWGRSKNHKEACRRWSKMHPERVKIAQQTALAYKTGKIKWQPCEVCGSQINLQKHHPDYTQPLKIKWLCRKCHTELHNQIRRTDEIHA